MKKNMVLGSVLFFALYCSGYAAVSVEWRGNGNNDWLYDSGTGYVGDGSYGNSWYVKLVVDDDGDNSTIGWNTILSNYKNGTWGLDTVETGDVVVDNDTFEYADSGWSKTTDIGNSYASKNLYVLFFNGSSVASSTQIGIVYASAGYWLSPAVDAPTSVVNIYDASASVYGTVSGGSFAQSSSYAPDSGDRWHTVPVPEPQTWGMMAMGLGMMLIAARRKMMK